MSLATVVAATGRPMTGGYTGKSPGNDPTTITESCEFTGGKWKVGVTTFLPAVPHLPGGVAPIFPGTNLGFSSSVLETRSGTYLGRYEFAELDGPGRTAVLTVDNSTLGRDTYPKTSGPAQQPITAAASLSIATALASSLNSAWA